MEFLVRVRGTADERDLWPYARCVADDDGPSLLLLTVHDSHELVGALAALASVGLHIISVQRRGGGSAADSVPTQVSVGDRSASQPNVNLD